MCAWCAYISVHEHQWMASDPLELEKSQKVIHSCFVGSGNLTQVFKKLCPHTHTHTHTHTMSTEPSLQPLQYILCFFCYSDVRFIFWLLFAWYQLCQNDILLFFCFVGLFFIYISNVISPLPQPSIPFPLLLLLWGCVLTHLPTPTSLPLHSPTLGHQAFMGPRASSPVDARQGHHPLLHIWQEPWVPQCVLFG